MVLFVLSQRHRTPWNCSSIRNLLPSIVLTEPEALSIPSPLAKTLVGRGNQNSRLDAAQLRGCQPSGSNRVKSIVLWLA